MTVPLLYNLILLGALLNALAKPLSLWLVGKSEVSNGVLGIQSAILICILMGLYSMYHAHRENSTLRWSRLDLLLCVAVCALCLLPFAKTSWLALILVSLIGIYRARDHKAIAFKTTLIIFLAIASRDLSSIFLMDLFASSFLTLDASMVSWLYILAGLEATTDLNMIMRPDGHSLSVMTGCASFKDISIALLLWFCLCRLKSEKPVGYWVKGATLLTFIVFAMNILRLSLMAYSPESYAYVHDGFGVQIFSFLFFFSIVALTIAGDHHARS